MLDDFEAWMTKGIMTSRVISDDTRTWMTEGTMTFRVNIG